MKTIQSFERIIKYNKMIWKCREIKHMLIRTRIEAKELLKTQNEWLTQRKEDNRFYNSEELKKIHEIYFDAQKTRNKIYAMNREIEVHELIIRDLLIDLRFEINQY